MTAVRSLSAPIADKWTTLSHECGIVDGTVEETTQEPTVGIVNAGTALR